MQERETERELKHFILQMIVGLCRERQRERERERERTQTQIEKHNFTRIVV